MEIQTKKFAVLIDADNASISAIPSVLEEVAKYGIASVKRVYGDWSSDTLKNWREVLLPHAITPVQQFAYTKGKDATDMILIIDAMDLLYAGALDGFCIVSSDSDFTPLASRIRENGLSVYGFGKKKTPEAFKKACDKFIYIENLISDSDLKNNEEEDIVDSDNKKIAETLKVIDQKMSSQSKEGLAPEMIDLSHPLAGVMGAKNALTFTTDLLGEVTIIGPGAGRKETGFAILTDILAIHNGKNPEPKKEELEEI